MFLSSSIKFELTADKSENTFWSGSRWTGEFNCLHYFCSSFLETHQTRPRPDISMTKCFVTLVITFNAIFAHLITYWYLLIYLEEYFVKTTDYWVSTGDLFPLTLIRKLSTLAKQEYTCAYWEQKILHRFSIMGQIAFAQQWDLLTFCQTGLIHKILAFFGTCWSFSNS